MKTQPLTKPISFLFIAVLIVSCNQNTVFKGVHKFDNFSWQKTDSIVFEFDIEDTSSIHLISFDVRHASYYLHENLDIVVEFYTPENDQAIVQLSLPLRDEDGSFKGKGLGDYWDTEIPVFDNFKFPIIGKYKFIIKNNMNELKTMAIMELGMKIKKVDK